jgi:hypothetical protein
MFLFENFRMCDLEYLEKEKWLYVQFAPSLLAQMACQIQM